MNKKGFSILDVSITLFLTLILMVPIGKYLLSSRLLMLSSEKNNKIINEVKETLMEVDSYKKEDVLKGISFSKDNISGSIKGKRISEQDKGSFFEKDNIRIQVIVEIDRGLKKHYEIYKTY